MESVLGIGVAVITSWWGDVLPALPFARSASLWCTPNRCCSSTMTSPRFLNSTSFWNKAWVPMMTAASPVRILASSSTRFFPVTRPDSQAVLMPSGASQLDMLMKCCSARSSVGAIRAVCKLFSKECTDARAAMTVLPEPTSP